MPSRLSIRGCRERVNDPTRLTHSPDEVVSLTGLSRIVIYRLIAAGELKSIKIGKRRLIRDADLRAFIDAQPTG